jgi:hypothetical protein
MSATTAVNMNGGTDFKIPEDEGARSCHETIFCGRVSIDKGILRMVIHAIKRRHVFWYFTPRTQTLKWPLPFEDE